MFGRNSCFKQSVKMNCRGRRGNESLNLGSHKKAEGRRTPRRFATNWPARISARFWTAVALHRFSRKIHIVPLQERFVS